MDKEILLSILGIIGGLAGTIRWLLGVYFKKESELEDLRKERLLSTIKQFDERLAHFDTTVSAHANTIESLEKKVEQAIVRYKDFQDANMRVQKHLADYVEASNQRVMAIEGKVVQLADDLFMLKSKGSKT